MTASTAANDYTRMLSLVNQLNEVDPEHGDSNVVMNFCDEYAPQGWEDNPDFDVNEFAYSMPKEFGDMVEEYLDSM